MDQRPRLAAHEDFADGSLLVLLLGRGLALANRVLGVDAFLGLGRRADRHLAEDVGIGAIVGLGPAVKRMFVALGTFEANAEKGRGGLFAPLLDGDVYAPLPEQVEAWPVGVIGGESLLGFLLDRLHLL